MNAINANKTLLYFPQIRPIDLIIARTSLESTLHIIILGILLLINIIYTEDMPLDNPFMFCSGLILMILLSASFGLTLSSLTKIFKSLDHFISPLLRPLLWISGVFFSASELPYNIRTLLLWNPLLHIIEIIRSGWFKSYNSEYYDINYVLIFIIIFTATGLTLERVTRRTIEV
jgi:capsular polysaccharide transport system permease protein